jgi:hypothetical protein
MVLASGPAQAVAQEHEVAEHEEVRPRLQLFIGPGLEADKHEPLGLIKIGVEWELFEPHPWDVALNAAWDIKEEYDAIAVGLSIGRLWP